MGTRPRPSPAARCASPQVCVMHRKGKGDWMMGEKREMRIVRMQEVMETKWARMRKRRILFEKTKILSAEHETLQRVL